MKWSLTPDEFAFVWRETKLDRYPAPLVVVETAQTTDDAALVRKAAGVRFPPGADPELSVALRVAARPSTHVQVLVEGEHSSRIAGCVVNATAAVIVQRSGRIDVELTQVHRFVESLVGSIPVVPGGAGGRLAIAARELTDAAPILTDAAFRSSAGDVRKRLRAQRSGVGYCGVQRFLDEEYPRPAMYFSWIDILGDGRYVVRSGRDIEIVPASSDVLREEFARLL